MRFFFPFGGRYVVWIRIYPWAFGVRKGHSQP